MVKVTCQGMRICLRKLCGRVSALGLRTERKMKLPNRNNILSTGIEHKTGCISNCRTVRLGAKAPLNMPTLITLTLRPRLLKSSKWTLVQRDNSKCTHKPVK